MPKLPPDYSFERDGISLPTWLWKLVDDEKPTRIAAGEALKAMDCGLPSGQTDWADVAPIPDVPAQMQRFAHALRETLADDSFDTPTFLEKLAALRLALARDWLQRVDISMVQMDVRGDKYERIAERVVKSINSAAGDAAKQRAEDRLAKLTALYIAGSCEDMLDDPFLDAESTASSGFAAARIFQILDVEFLKVPTALAALLNDSKLRWNALAILQRCGPAAIDWAPRLLQDFDQFARKREKTYGFDAAQALGSVGRGNHEVVDALVSRLSHPQKFVRRAAADVLQHMHGEVCGRNDEICQLLLPLLDEEETSYYAVRAIASVGRNNPEMRAKILARGAPQLPQLKNYPAFEDYQYDQVMHDRAAAFDAIEYFVDYPDECLPVLIDALDNFVEFDPDESYRGPHERVSRQIAQFGTAAAPAALPLARHLNDDPDEFPMAMLDCLSAIGPAAGAALPLLRKLHKKYPPADDQGETDLPPDRDEDPIGWTIRQITGEPE